MPPQHERLENLLPRRVSRLARLLYRETGSPLPRGMRSVLFALSSQPLRITQIAEQEGIGQPGATRMVKRLEHLGLVTRKRSSSDGRAVIVALSDRGRAELELMREQSRRVMRKVMRELDAQDLARLEQASEALQVLIDLIESWPSAAWPRAVRSEPGVERGRASGAAASARPQPDDARADERRRRERAAGHQLPQ
ncbi:MAG TPA: MarR family transcriptional regulator [Solirubrobacteraceae bacterium]|nr:MarR family transcriptional regulator [Solirubrobacteraceae bacterium]